MPQSWPVALKASGGTPTDDVEAELILARPDVGAVAVDHERQIAEAARRRCACARACCHCVCASHCRYWRNSISRRELAARVGERRRLAAPKRLGPLGPRPLVLARVDRAEERVVVEPPGLLGEEAPRSARARSVSRRHSASTNRSKARAERRALQPPDAGVVDRAATAGRAPSSARVVASTATLAAGAANSGTAATLM